ncbi:UDP-glucuronosyltransferase 2B20-like [Folsomia candida]|uniref:UDP-glucuronosyltransferase 2B20-like n=1 Tax=Folsomia candida TaxID=158441 RepID=UPI000B9063AA|nr:UDP-glucuronosyltransferase 2B20-like [Folsomia candida]
MKLRIVFVFVVLLMAETNSENILFYWGVSGYSHRISVWGLIDKLVEKGHKVTFISPYEAKVPYFHPNITDIVPMNLAEDVGIIRIDFISMRLKNGVQAIDDLWYEYYDAGIRGCKSLMQNEQVLKWINESSYDLVILNALYNDCGYGLVHKFQAPHIMYTTTTHFPWFKDAYGFPDENLPEMEFHYPLEMTFVQSIRNLVSGLYWQWKRHTELFPILEPLLRSALKIPDLPPLHEIEMNTSLIFTNTHPSEEFPRSLPPNVVEIGGIHCSDDRKPLPQDLEDFIASGDNGFILLSFGTFAAINNLPIHLQHVFFNAMKAVPKYQFLVKYNQDRPDWVPKNVHTLKWVQQQDLIAHPKIRAFIGHGGLLSTQEAIFHGVPMIIVPLFAEQDYQAVRANDRETAIALEIAELTEEKLLNAILEVTSNPKYKTNTMRLSKFFRDRQNQPLESAIWWVEYVMRHKDISHLRPVGITKSWYERRMLHIWGFLAISLLCFLAIALYFTIAVLKMMTKTITKNKQE